MPRPLLYRAAILCCCLLLFAPSSSLSSSSSSSSTLPSSVAASAAGALQPESEDATTATDAAPTAATLSFPSSSSAARRLGGGRVPASLGRDSDRDRRRSSFSVVDSATAPTTTTTVPTALLSRPSRPRRRSRRSRRSPLPLPLPPTIDIYVRTFSGDAAWLTWLLRSIEENVEEDAFRSLVVSVPRGDAGLFEALLPSFRLRIVLLVVDDDRFERATEATKSRTEYGGYHAQMFDKLTRPPLYSDADYFVHVDSDCVFQRQPVARRPAKEEAEQGEEEEQQQKPLFRKVSRSDFVDARGRVRVKRVAFASLPEPFRRWQRAAEGMLLEPVPYETMSCFPLVFPREVYGLVGELVLERHGGGDAPSSSPPPPPPSERVGEREGEGEGGGAAGGGGEGSSSSSAPSPLLRVLSQRLDDFGEFTAMGHVLTTRMGEGEGWVPDSSEGVGGGGDLGGGGKGGGGEELPESFCALTHQAWSWGSVTPEAAAEAERNLRVGW